MTGRQRMDYMKQKAAEYYRLRDVWRLAVQQGPPVTGELAYVTSMVRKDVLRTDRLHPFYAGNDDNQNIASLFNILTTYALNHPAVSYCQGMSDIASPLLGLYFCNRFVFVLFFFCLFFDSQVDHSKNRLINSSKISAFFTLELL